MKLINEYHDIMNKYYPNTIYSYISLEGFISAKIVVATLEQIGKKASRNSFIKNIQNLSEQTLKKHNLLKIIGKNRYLKDVSIVKYNDNKEEILKVYKIKEQ